MTTEEELEGFHVVKAIVREVVDARRVFMRDTKSYCGILLDDNNRKPICRLHFNAAKKKYIGVFDTGKAETRHAIQDVTDIYKHADTLRHVVEHYAAQG